MQPHTQHLLPTLPLVAPDPSGASPTDIVSALVGVKELVLPGFADRSARAGHWRHPSVPFVPVRHFDEVVPQLGERRQAWRRAVLVGLGILLFCSAFAAGVFVSSYMNDWLRIKATAAPATGPTWAIVDVVPAGVMIVLDGSRPILMPLGVKLPNGDSVVSVAPERRTAFLESSTVVLRPLVAPQPLAPKEQQ